MIWYRSDLAVIPWCTVEDRCPDRYPMVSQVSLSSPSVLSTQEIFRRASVSDLKPTEIWWSPATSNVAMNSDKASPCL